MTIFPESSMARVFFLPPGCDFSEEFTKGLIERFAPSSPLAMAQAEIYLNTGRVRRGIIKAFGEQGTYLLPKMRLVTELAHDSRFFEIAPPVPGLRRKLELFQAVSKLLEKDDRFAAQSSAFDLADSLGRLMDEMHAEGVSPDQLRQLDVSQHSAHWAQSLKFINIMSEFWYRTDIPDTQARQRMVVERLVEKWQLEPPSHPVLVAGSTGSRGATRLLMETVAKLPQGAVILPCFDADLPDSVWNGMDDSTTGQDHPQFRFISLFKNLKMRPKDVAAWRPHAKTNSARNRLMSLALRPAPVTNQWLAEGPQLKNIDKATENLTLLEAPHPRAEALAIAYRLRQAAEMGESAALVTPDRRLAKQVKAALSRWRIQPQDSFDLSLSDTQVGRLLLQVSACIGHKINAPSLINLLRHPIVHSLSHPNAHHNRVDRLEFSLRRHQKADDFEHQLETLFPKDWDDEVKPWNNWLMGILAQLEAAQEANLAEFAALHRSIAQTLMSGSSATSKSSTEWTMFAGSTALDLICELEREGVAGGDVDFQSYHHLFTSLARRQSVPRGEQGNFPGIHIWNTLDARMQSPDVIIAGGLNEGQWPAAAPIDPWLNRTLRHEAGLLMPERNTGLLAHDFQQAASARHVVLSRSERLANEPSVPSRWLIRLTTLLAGIGDDGKSALAAMQSRGQQLIKASQAMEHSHPAEPRELRPNPKPPIEARPRQLSVTAIKTLISNPYEIYASRILGLRELAPLQLVNFAALRGQIMHKIVQNFVAIIAKTQDKCTPQAFMSTAEDILASAPVPLHLQRLWWVQLNDMAPDFIAQELERLESAIPAALEASGRMALDKIDFELTARCDRIDQLNDESGLIVYDYKTGALPGMAEIKRRDKQIPLTVKMLEKGGFSTIEPQDVSQAAYIKIGKSTEVKFVDKGLVEDTWQGLLYLIARYQKPDTGYLSRRNMYQFRYGEAFDHLARYGEWEESTDLGM